jgi:hypothetical protein
MGTTSTESRPTAITVARRTGAERPETRPHIRRHDLASTGRGVGPRSRPRGLTGPYLAGSSLRQVRACNTEAAVELPVRLTERGIAVILFAAVVLLVAAAVVIGLTAVRVTGPNYVPYGQTSVVER